MSKNIWSALDETTWTGPSPICTGSWPATGSSAMPRRPPADGTILLLVTIASIIRTELGVGEPPVSPVP